MLIQLLKYIACIEVFFLQSWKLGTQLSLLTLVVKEFFLIPLLPIALQFLNKTVMKRLSQSLRIKFP